MATRVIVCGSRTFEDRKLCFETLNQVLDGVTDVEIVSGHAKGADMFGEEYGDLHGFKVSIFKPDWKMYGRGAGPVRNRRMLEYALEDKALVIAFWDGKSKGTKNMMNLADKAGADVKVIYL